MKIIRFLSDNIFFIFTLFLLAFIPLYPKRPILDVINTWVYIRVEDFVVILILLVWAIFLLRKKITLKTPLTMPIFLFWIIGAVATIHGVLLVFPSIANVFPNVAFLSFLRRVEYVSLFFVSFVGIKEKRFLPYIVAVLTITLLLVVGYGIGQKYFGFPAFLTMNEEFAKGQPIRLSSLSRVPSTFGGHYDLAAYLVLVVPILISVVFGIKKLIIKLVLLTSAALGFILVFMTVSRISFFVLLISVACVFFLQKKRLVILSLPVVALLAFLLLGFAPGLMDRFGNTIKEVDVLVDAKTGEAIGHAKEVPSKYFENKIIMQDYVLNKGMLGAMTVSGEDKNLASQSAMLATPSAVLATSSAIIPYTILPSKVVLLVPTNLPTGENLPQGTGYINLSLSPVKKKIGEYFFEQSKADSSGAPGDVLIIHGNFLIKKALAYDLSFTTRFQGEWPSALEAFKRNVLLGSGYGSISLAVDNNYLRMLGEVGVLGFVAFFAIFAAAVIYIRKILPDVDSPLVKSFVLGFVSGVIGLIFNAIFIDVFEASKIAFLLWLLTGITLGVLSLYQTKRIDLYKEFKKIFTSTYAVIVYLCIFSWLVFSPMIGNFFTGDDFTWFRWVSDCGNTAVSSQRCPISISSIFKYFIESDGFFYRPGPKIYFLLMHSIFWLNQVVYHIASIFLHFFVATLVFLLARKILRDFFLSALAGFLFLLQSGYSEAVFWISTTGFLFTSAFSLLSVLLFILWEEKKRRIYFISCMFSFIFATFFHELGIITPLLIIVYKFSTDESFSFKDMLKKTHFLLLFFPILPYLAMRFIAGSHWFNGDYSYNLLKLPFNIAGNAIGYFFLTVFGPASLSLYHTMRNFSKENMVLAMLVTVVVVSIIVLICKLVIKRFGRDDRRVVFFGFLFFVIALLPFLGLGNIASRYSYLSTAGFVILFVFFVKKLYRYLLGNGRDIAIVAVIAVVTVYSLLHIIQVQQIHGDWKTAGEKVQRFFISIDEAYADYWAKGPMKFYFVNVPIRTGEAWIFPVGLNDGLWLVFRNTQIRIYQSSSVEEALSFVDGSIYQKVFEFDNSGKVFERKKIVNVR